MVRSRLLVAFAASASATSSPRAADDYALVRGVPLWDQGRFLPRFACPRSGVEIAFERVNDDFCDCAFGGDEPGTAACAGREHAAGFRCPGDGARVSASKVSDGVADCCDASDEKDMAVDVPPPYPFARGGTSRPEVVGRFQRVC